MADKLTPKQEKFAQNVAKGMSKKDAAKQAGYSEKNAGKAGTCLLYTSPRPRDLSTSRMPSSA